MCEKGIPSETKESPELRKRMIRKEFELMNQIKLY